MLNSILLKIRWIRDMVAQANEIITLKHSPYMYLLLQECSALNLCRKLDELVLLVFKTMQFNVMTYSCLCGASKNRLILYFQNNCAFKIITLGCLGGTFLSFRLCYFLWEFGFQ